MKLSVINPESLFPPRGYSNGIRGSGEIVFVAGQVGWSRSGSVVSDDFVLQFGQALENVLDVVFAAGGRADSIARMTVYVTDKQEYLRRSKEVGAAWRQRMGKHFPAMALVEVKSLLDDQAKVEIEATALV